MGAGCFRILSIAMVAILGRAGEDAQRVEEVTKWIVDHFLKVEVGVFD